MYSEMQRDVFCSPCMLFGRSPLAPNIANPQKGFSDWRYLNPRKGEHENSPDHHQNDINWRALVIHLNIGHGVDIASENQKWRAVLKKILHAIIFCATNNLALRGSCNTFGQPNSGIFVNFLNAISQYNSDLAGHIKKHKKGSVNDFLPAIQNDCINLLGTTVRQEKIE